MHRRAFLRLGTVAGLSLSLGGCLTPSALEPEGSDEPYEPLGRVPVEGAAEAVVGDDNEIVYLAATDGFATVDASDPTDPTVLAERRDLEVDGRSLTEILDVKVSNDRLVVPGPANPGDDEAFHGFVCYDVSDPANPVPASEPYETGYHIHNCFLDGDTLYLVRNGAEGNPLVVFDVADDEPEELARWSILEREPAWEDVEWRLQYLHDVTVHDDVAVLAYWNAGTHLLDVSDPADSRYLGGVVDPDVEIEDQRDLVGEAVDDAYFGLPGNDHYSALDDRGELLAVGRESWERGSDDPDGPGGIDLYDASDLTAPSLRAAIEAPPADDATYHGGTWTTAHNFELREGRLYSSWYQGGVKIHDVTDPADPVELAWWRDPDEAGFWTARVLDENVFVASSTPMIPNASTEGALYTFPIREGEQADPPSLVD